MVGERTRVLALVGICVWLTFFWNLGGPKLWDRDEPRNAGCVREMRSRGDLMVPVFNGELRTHKPILLYWAMLGTTAIWGDNEFGARAASALAGLSTVLATFWAGRRIFGLRAACIAAVVLSSTLMFTVAARAATPDSLLICCSTWALAIAAVSMFGVESPVDGSMAGRASEVVERDPGAWPLLPTTGWYGWGMYVAMALAVLAKGPVGFILPAAVIGMYLLIAGHQRQVTVQESVNAPVWWKQLVRTAGGWFGPRNFVRALLGMRLPIGLMAVAWIAVPWYAWVGWRTDGEWLKGFFFEHNVGRAMRSMEGHSGNIAFYPVAILVGFFPWSIFTVPVIVRLVRSLRLGRMNHETARLTFLACWVCVYVGLFSMARTKLPSYVTPTYPALALMWGWFLDGWLSRRDWIDSRWIYAALGTLGFVGLSLVIGLPIAAHHLLPGEEWTGLIGLAPLLGAAIGVWTLLRRRPAMTVICVGAASVVLVGLAFGWVAVRVSRHQAYDRLLAEVIREPDEQGRLVVKPGSEDGVRLLAFRRLEPSWVYYAGRTIEPVDERERDLIPQRMRTEPGTRLIVTQEDWQRLSSELAWPSDVTILGEAPYFLRDHRLLLVGRPAQLARRTTP